MKILRKNVEFLTNIEAKDMIRGSQNVDFELITKYSAKDKVSFETKKSKLKDLGLYDFEIIQLLNFVPTQILHLQLVVEEMEERFDEEKLEKIIQIFD